LRKQPHQAQAGFLTFAQNTADVDYLRLAYLQALNIKSTQRNNQFAIIVDSQTEKEITEKQRRIFDFVVVLDEDHAQEDTWKLSNEWQAFWLTPFKETVKLESDLLFTRSIDHWWHALRTRELVLSHGCKNYLQKTSLNRRYRRTFDETGLPDVYNGLMYFRFSRTASTFFAYARDIFRNWDSVRDQCLKNCRDEKPTTDIVYALAAEIVGRENCTIPSLDFVNFVHMKPSIQNWHGDNDWQDCVVSEFDSGMIRINNINQYHPLHYQDKTFPTDGMIDYYERRITGTAGSI
jgi:hypothetical protein